MLFASDQPESSLYKYFHEFLEELQSIKLAPEEASRVQQQLWDLFERQRRDASQRGGEQHAQLYRQAQYLMVAFADELFLHLYTWEGRDAWQKEFLLETKMFNSRTAGQAIFDRLDQLLNQRDPHMLELARLYLIVLALGFEGKYRNITEVSSRSRFNNDYRKQLFLLITQRNPDNLSTLLHHDLNKRICPEAYKYTLQPQRVGNSRNWWHRFLVFLNLREPDYEGRRWLPPEVIWWKWLLAAFLGGLLVSGMLWQAWTSELYRQAKSIVDNNKDQLEK